MYIAIFKIVLGIVISECTILYEIADYTWNAESALT
jgi:hypothetical protein